MGPEMGLSWAQASLIQACRAPSTSVKVSIRYPLVLDTKALGLINLIVVISLLELGGESVEGYIKVLGNLGFGLESLLP